MGDSMFEQLPEDPPGWRIRLLADNSWEPYRNMPDAEPVLGSFGTKQEAVDAINSAGD